MKLNSGIEKKEKYTTNEIKKIAEYLLNCISIRMQMNKVLNYTILKDIDNLIENHLKKYLTIKL